MNYKLLLGVTALMCGMQGIQAQETIYSQDFEGSPQSIFDEGWLPIAFIGTTELNGIVNSNANIVAAGFTGNTFGSASFELNNNFPIPVDGVDSVIRSTSVAIPEGHTELSYRVGSLGMGGAGNSHYSVYAVIAEELEGLDLTTGLQAVLDEMEPLDSAMIGGQSSVITVNLSAYAGNEVTFFFRLHETAGSALLLFDDIIVTATTLSTENPGLNLFSVYPNPVQNVLNISGTEQALINGIRVYNATGQLVTYRSFNAVESYNLDMGGLASGMYIIKMISDSGTEVKRIVKS